MTIPRATDGIRFAATPAAMGSVTNFVGERWSWTGWEVTSGVKGMIVSKQNVTPGSSVGLDVRIVNELVEKARQTGVSLVGEGGLLAGITRTVLQAALDAQMAEHVVGYDKGEAPAIGGKSQTA